MTGDTQAPLGNGSTIAGVPLNRLVAFVGPYISSLAGIVAAWLLVHVHLFSLLHFGGDQVAQGIAQLVTFVTVAGLTWLGHSKWLSGHIAWEQAVVNAAQGVSISAPLREGISSRRTDTPVSLGEAEDESGPVVE